MADPNTRQGKRTPVTLKIKFKSETLEQFIERYAVDVSQGGIFIRTKEPLAVGTQMKFEFQLRDASPLIAGEGTVVWTRENDPSRPAIAPGMGVRFDRLGDGSQNVLEKILAEKAKQAPQRGDSNTAATKPPMFTDTPTRVAPAPMQEQLLGQKSGRTRADSQETPLPKPMPFHSDADEFGAEAFEEATKVRALDELVAQTAAAENSQAAEDLVRGRRDSVPAPIGIDRDSAPGLPSPPEPSGRTGKLLDTTPSPREASAPARTSAPSIPPATNIPERTRLGLEPAKAPVRHEATERVPQQRAVAAEPNAPVPKRPSAAPVVIGIMFLVAVALFGVWYFVLREKVADEVANGKTGSAGSAVVTNTNLPVGSNGSAVAMVGSNGSAGSAAVTPPAGPTVETEIAANVAKATVTVEDSDQSGPAPFKAKLEKDKAYKVRVEAPGYAKLELDVKGGQDKATAKLVAKPHVLTVSSDPAGATIFIDNASTGKKTPADVELTAAQAAKKSVHVSLHLGGYKVADQMVDASSLSDGDTKMLGTVDAKLAVAPVVVVQHPVVPNGNGSGSSTGSATPEGSGSSDGSAAPSSSGGGGGGGSAAPPAGGGGEIKAGSGDEPAPDWSKKTAP